VSITAALPYFLAIARFLLLRVAINFIPIFGLAYGGWSGATALTVYWFETAVGSLLVAIRIFIHERLTHKRGHYRAQLGVTVSSTTNEGPTTAKQVNSFFGEFLLSAILFTVAHGIFLAAFLVIALKTAPDWETVQRASLTITLFLLVGFLVDLVTIRSQPFVWIKAQAGAQLGRVLLMQFAIIIGVGIAAFSGHNEFFYLPFAGLKLVTDLLGELPRQKDPNSSPGWLNWLMRHIKPRKGDKEYKGWDDYLAKERARDRAKETEDELIGRPAAAWQPVRK
jgi:hypothetical protein